MLGSDREIEEVVDLMRDVRLHDIPLNKLTPRVKCYHATEGPDSTFAVLHRCVVDFAAHHNCKTPAPLLRMLIKRLSHEVVLRQSEWAEVTFMLSNEERPGYITFADVFGNSDVPSKNAEEAQGDSMQDIMSVYLRERVENKTLALQEVADCVKCITTAKCTGVAQESSVLLKSLGLAAIGDPSISATDAVAALQCLNKHAKLSRLFQSTPRGILMVKALTDFQAVLLEEGAFDKDLKFLVEFAKLDTATLSCAASDMVKYAEVASIRNRLQRRASSAFLARRASTFDAIDRMLSLVIDKIRENALSQYSTALQHVVNAVRENKGSSMSGETQDVTHDRGYGAVLPLIRVCRSTLTRAAGLGIGKLATQKELDMLDHIFQMRAAFLQNFADTLPLIFPKAKDAEAPGDVTLNSFFVCYDTITNKDTDRSFHAGVKKR